MLDASVLPTFLLAVFVLAVVPGPDLALIVSHALARGVRAGVWCSVGIAVAGFLQTALVALGLGHLMQHMPVIAEAVRLVGAAYLLWIGIGLLMRARHGADGASDAPRMIDGEDAVWLGPAGPDQQFAQSQGASGDPYGHRDDCECGCRVGSRFGTSSVQTKPQIRQSGHGGPRNCLCRPCASNRLPGDSRPLMRRSYAHDVLAGANFS